MLKEPNYKDLATELIRAVRGKKSQAYLNQKLGFSGNQIYRWEKGLRNIGWEDFVKVCGILNVDILKTFRVHFGYRKRSLDSTDIVRHLLGNLTMNEAVKVTRFSRSILTKWNHRTTSPQLHQILQLIEHPNQLLIVFVNDLLGKESLEGLQKYERKVNQLKEFYYAEPVLAGISAFLETSRFDTRLSFVKAMSRIFRMDEGRIEEILDQMFQMKILEPGTSFTKAKIRNVDTRGSFEGSKRLREFWFSHCVQAVHELQPRETSHLFPYFIFSVSEEANAKIREAHYRYVSHLKAIIDEDTGDKAIVRSITIGDVELRES